jgi:hypothetical protein
MSVRRYLAVRLVTSQTCGLADGLLGWLGCALSDVHPLLSGEAERQKRG